MMKDCQPRLIFVNGAALGEGVAQAWPEAPRRVLFDEALRQPVLPPRLSDAPNPRQEGDTVTIIYTSGTSGEQKAVGLNPGILTHILPSTPEALIKLMASIL